MDGRQLSTAAGWHWSKTSRIEHGKQLPSESDLAVWCQVCAAELKLPDLVAALRNVQTQWAEWSGSPPPDTPDGSGAVNNSKPDQTTAALQPDDRPWTPPDRELRPRGACPVHRLPLDTR
ncbi:hypothetical protein LTT61_30470 [Nocardia asteroides]|nr:hypothetical protein LTT61_30470 [Nocardia asteroides]